MYRPRESKAWNWSGEDWSSVSSSRTRRRSLRIPTAWLAAERSASAWCGASVRGLRSITASTPRSIRSSRNGAIARNRAPGASPRSGWPGPRGSRAASSITSMSGGSSNFATSEASIPRRALNHSRLRPISASTAQDALQTRATYRMSSSDSESGEGSVTVSARTTESCSSSLGMATLPLHGRSLGRRVACFRALCTTARKRGACRSGGPCFVVRIERRSEPPSHRQERRDAIHGDRQGRQELGSRRSSGREDPDRDGEVQRAAGQGRRDAGGRGPALQQGRRAGALRRQEAHRHRRALLRDEGADRRLLALAVQVEGRGDRVAEAGAVRRRHRGGDPAGVRDGGVRGERSHGGDPPEGSGAARDRRIAQVARLCAGGRPAPTAVRARTDPPMGAGATIVRSEIATPLLGVENQPARCSALDTQDQGQITPAVSPPRSLPILSGKFACVEHNNTTYYARAQSTGAPCAAGCSAPPPHSGS